jgi:hypothetical protein
MIFLFSDLPSLHGLPLLLYICYMGVVITAMNLAMGTIGFLSSAAFVFSIFSHVNIEGKSLETED